MVSGCRDDQRDRDRAFGCEKSAEDEADRGRPQHENHPSMPPLERWERRIRDAKKAHRPRLRNWTQDRFGVQGSRAAAAFEALKWDHEVRDGVEGIWRERRDELTPREFWQNYEKRRRPVLVSGIPSQEGWGAGERWSLEQLERR